MNLMTVKEVAESLRVTPRIISIWLKKGKLPGYKVGFGKRKRWRISREALQSFLKKQANEAQREFDEEKEWNSIMQVLENAPIDDELLTEEEIRGIEESEKDIAEGRVYPWEEIKKELDL